VNARLWTALTALLLTATPAAAAPASSSGGAGGAPGEPALRLEKGSLARNQLVAVGRDLVIEGNALADVAAVNGSVEVTGEVDGDVIVLAGDARLRPSARVAGDVFVVGGVIQAAGARVGGRLVSYPTASQAWLTLMEGPALGLSAVSPLVLGAKISLLAAWAALLLLLFAASGRQVLETAEGVRREPFHNFFTGLTCVLAITMTALFFGAFLGGIAGVPLLTLIVFLALALKLWGMVAVFYALGQWITRHVLRRTLRPLNAATLGLLALGILKFVPWIDVLAWNTATLIGIGATLSTKFGRREPWFELA
jgi:hypothetical protein